MGMVGACLYLDWQLANDVILSPDQVMASSPTIWVALLCFLALQLQASARYEVVVVVSLSVAGDGHYYAFDISALRLGS